MFVRMTPDDIVIMDNLSSHKANTDFARHRW
jgi:hypothetical protein